MEHFLDISSETQRYLQLNIPVPKVSKVKAEEMMEGE